MNTRLELLGLIQQFSHLTSMLEDFALTRAHGYMPGHSRVSSRTLLNTLVHGIRPDRCLLSVQQAVRLGDVMIIADETV
jgi:hypothetical protein